MNLKFKIKGPSLGAFFFMFCFIFLTECSTQNKNNNFFSKEQAKKVEIFTVRDFYTQGVYQLYFDVANKNETVTIGRMAIYVFDKDCKNVKDDETSNNILYSNHVFIQPYQNGVITFLPKKRLKCYLVMGYEKYL